jgi:hypothetical protein
MLLFHTARPILTTSAGINLAKGWNGEFLTLYRDTTADVVLSERVIGVVDVKDSDRNEEEKSEAYTRHALGFVETNWRLLPAIVMRKVVGALNPFPETPRAGILETGRAAWQIVSFLPLFFVLGTRRAGRLRLLAAAMLAAYLLMSVLTMGTVRYRFPLIWVELLCVVWVIDCCGRALLTRTGVRRHAGAPGATTAQPNQLHQGRVAAGQCS